MCVCVCVCVRVRVCVSVCVCVWGRVFCFIVVVFGKLCFYNWMFCPSVVFMFETFGRCSRFYLVYLCIDPSLSRRYWVLHGSPIEPWLKRPRRMVGDVWCYSPLWNLRAVIWFLISVSCLVLGPSRVLSCPYAAGVPFSRLLLPEIHHWVLVTELQVNSWWAARR